MSGSSCSPPSWLPHLVLRAVLVLTTRYWWVQLPNMELRRNVRPNFRPLRRTVARSKSVITRMAWPTQHVPSLVDKTFYGAQTNQTSE